ncbi:Putative zinc-binding ribosomal protein [Colletotrichum destructivum]|uniref:Large ribosomal subunit protein bL33m n=1 Tax=Colletotrichum destructivum TaxID=34406 RepID=A0AAX4IK32_9PEZI|nr:Putative zinc-binding ribosomal protein [Colletotrichum destructivum]
MAKRLSPRQLLPLDTSWGGREDRNQSPWNRRCTYTEFSPNRICKTFGERPVFSPKASHHLKIPVSIPTKLPVQIEYKQLQAPTPPNARGATPPPRWLKKVSKSRVMIVRLLSMAATGYFYTFKRLRTASPMSMLKYDPIIRRKVLFLEQKKKGK